MNAPERIWIDTSFIDSTRTMPVLAGNLGTAKPDRKLATDVEYRRADLPPTDAEVMNHPKVKALVEALELAHNRLVWASGLIRNDTSRDIAAGHVEETRAALAAIQEAKP